MPNPIKQYWIYWLGVVKVRIAAVCGKEATMQIVTVERSVAGRLDDIGRSRNGLDANRVVGQARVRIFDREDHHTFTNHLQLVTGGRLGASQGYSTLKQAMFELGGLTKGEQVGAAAILERDGRFFGHVLKGRDLERGVRAPLRPAYFETDKRAIVTDYRTVSVHDRLRAIVDGVWVHRFRVKSK